MIIKVFLLFILNHIIFDFIFQGKSIIKNRFPKEVDLSNKKNIWRKIKVTIKGNIIHSLLHFIGMIIIIVFIKTNKLTLFIKALNISFLHFFIDEIKSILVLYKNKYRNNIWIFISDQIMHLLAISMIILGVNNIRSIYGYNLDTMDKILLTVVVLFIVTVVTGIFIKVFINDLMPEKKTPDTFNEIINSCESVGAKNGGFIIGILERILIFISMIIEYYSIIGFILTAKSIARFNKLSDQCFAEYFIIGNLISFTSAILGGIFIRYILKN